MRDRIENLLKTNSFFNRLYTFTGSFLVRLIGLFVKKDPNTILFVSYMGKNYNDSPKLIYESMISDKYFKNFTFIWAFNDVDKYNFNNENTKVVKMDSFEYLLTALRAEYWVTNVNIERGLHFKKNYTKSINTWHGIPFKKIGNDVKGRNDFDFSNTDIFCYSGDYELEIYKRAFKLSNRNLFKTGMPRNDIVLGNDQTINENIRKKYNIIDKKIILYAPTWREKPNDLQLMNLNKWKKELDDDYVLFIKAHGLSTEFNIKENHFVIDVSDYEETSDLLIASDILITDYSSIMFDYALLNKQIYLYIPDYEKYVDERGAYFNLKTSGLDYFEEDSSLLEAIRKTNDLKIDDSLNFINDFNDIIKPDATSNVIKLIKEEKI